MEFFFIYLCSMQPKSAVMKNAIALFFEGLMLLFIVVFCSFAYVVKTEPFKTASLHTGSLNELVMNEGVLYNGLEQLSTNSLDFEWDIDSFEIQFTRTVKLAVANLFINASTHNVFYVFTTSSAP